MRFLLFTILVLLPALAQGPPKPPAPPIGGNPLPPVSPATPAPLTGDEKAELYKLIAESNEVVAQINALNLEFQKRQMALGKRVSELQSQKGAAGLPLDKDLNWRTSKNPDELRRLPQQPDQPAADLEERLKQGK